MVVLLSGPWGSESGGLSALVGTAKESALVNSEGARSWSFRFDFGVVLLEYLVRDDGETGFGSFCSCDRFGFF
jgi:hypothetical protein